MTMKKGLHNEPCETSSEGQVYDPCRWKACQTPLVKAHELNAASADTDCHPFTLHYFDINIHILHTALRFIGSIVF